MKIISLQAENFKRLTAIEITPDGAMVEITGRNGAGKTSCLDAIWACLGGEGVLPTVPIRKGEEKAFIRLDLGSLIVTRRFNIQEGGDYTTSLKVENDEGASFNSPQKMLNGLVGALSFDPLAFISMKPAEQFEVAKAFVPDVDFAGMKKANDDDFESRTEINRSARALRVQAEAIFIADTDATEHVDVAALITQRDEAQAHNAEIERKRQELKTYADATAALQEEADRVAANMKAVREQLVALEKQHGELAERVVNRETKLGAASPLPEPIDTTQISTQILGANGVNEAIANRAKRAQMEAEATALEQQSADLTKGIEARKHGAAVAVASAKMPIDGLGFGDGFVVLNGVPLDQASDAEQLRTSIAIGLALNPKLRVMRVRDGSLLDKASWKLLADFADTQDCQIWVETVESGRPGAVMIEDGHVRGQEQEPVAAE